VKVSFSEGFIIPSNATEIFNSTTLGVKLIPKNYAMTSMLKFEWKLLSFNTDFMEL